MPGIHIEFYDYGSGDQRLRYCSLVETGDFRIVFGRNQGIVEGGHWCDTAAASEIWVPRVYVHAYGDSSPLRGCTYDGSDWERDRAAFWERHVWPDDPRYLRQRGTLPHGAVLEICRYLREVALPRIEAYPVAAEKPAPNSNLGDDPILPVPEWLREVYCWATRDDAARIMTGRRDPRALAPWQRYGMTFGGWRLVPFGDSDGAPLPKLAYEGFLWCGTRAPVARTTRPGRRHRDEPTHDLIVPGNSGHGNECVVIVVRPRSSHEIYVADQAVWDRRRHEIATVPGRGSHDYSRDEIRDFTSARARTLVPASAYTGDYGDPVVLVHRELGFDEVDILPGQDLALLENLSGDGA